MQTRVPAPAEATKQQRNSAPQLAQLPAEQNRSFEDHRPETAQLTALQTMMNNSPPQQQTQVMQAKMIGSAQAQQMRTLQARMAGSDVAQREELEEPLQAQVDGGAVQREEVATASEAPKPNNTGLPDNLKSGIESLSGMSMDHVKVHYNSSQPAQLNAHAYAQGSEIHVAPGQEQHVPHEAWHVVQQAQGRVKPTMQMKMGVSVNDDVGLETEADVMGAKAAIVQKHSLNSQAIFRPPSAGPKLIQMAPIVATKGEAEGWVKGTNAGSNFVHFNIQMSGDSRLAVASVGHAQKNETGAFTNGLIVSVPRGTDDGGATPHTYVDRKLYGSLSSAGVGDTDTKIYATTAANPHESRTESLNNWRGWQSRYQPPLPRRRLPGRHIGWNVYQTGGVSEYVTKYENLGAGDQSLKTSLEQDYGVKDDAGLAIDETRPAAGVLGGLLSSFNQSGKVVLWFKGDPTLSGSVNSLQTAKTEHWLGADAGVKIINKLGVGNVVIAGTLSVGYKTILDRLITNANQYFTVDKLQAAGLNNIADQYGFFYRYGANMTHFGGRSGNLEPLAALGLNTIYFEEKGNGQANRDLHIGADNHIDKVVIDGVTSSAGIVSKGVSWLNPRTGLYRTGSPENADANQKAYYDKVINRWMGFAEDTAMTVDRRKGFHGYFLDGQDRNKTMAQNSASFKGNMVFPGQIRTPAQHEEDVLSNTDLNKIVDEIRLKGPGGHFKCVKDNIATLTKDSRFYAFADDDSDPTKYVTLPNLLASWNSVFAGVTAISDADVKNALLGSNDWIIDGSASQAAESFSLFDHTVFGGADVNLG